MDITLKTSVDSTPTVSSEAMVSPEVMTFFNVDVAHMSKEERKKIEELTSYLEGVSDDPFEQVAHIRELRYRLGTPMIGQTDLDNVHKYIRLREAAKATNEQAQAMED